MSKQLLDRLDGGYALLIEESPHGRYVFVGSENRGGESKVIMLDDARSATVTTEVGGMMHILPIPGRPGRYVAAMGMYAPFIGKDAAIYLLGSGAAPLDAWSVDRLFAMPFAHRLGLCVFDGRLFLFVATVSSHKENPEDWSRPGQLFVEDFDASLESGEWQLKTISDQIHRNHGMWNGTLDGEQVLLVSGAEGVFAVRRQTASASGFALEQLVAGEVSEMVVADLDGDGVDEMVTIEPFHGETLRVYRRSTDGEWASVWQTDDLSFAHGLNVIPHGDLPLVVVGNRRQGMELLAFDFAAKLTAPRRTVIDSGVGPTQIEPISDGRDGVARFVSCNQGAGEVSRYDFA